MFIGLFMLVIMAIVGAYSKNVNVRRAIFILGFLPCWLASDNMLIVFGILSVGWLIIYGGTITGIQKSKAIAYLANKHDESK